jgi:hypothetical protein
VVTDFMAAMPLILRRLNNQPEEARALLDLPQLEEANSPGASLRSEKVDLTSWDPVQASQGRIGFELTAAHLGQDFVNPRLHGRVVAKLTHRLEGQAFPGQRDGHVAVENRHLTGSSVNAFAVAVSAR